MKPNAAMKNAVLDLALQTSHKRLTYREIGRMVGLSSSRVGQILQAERNREWRDLQRIIQDSLPVGDREIWYLPLSYHVRRSLEDNHIVYVRDLLQRSEVDLLRLYNFGRASLKEVRVFLDQNDLALQPNPSSSRAPRAVYEKCPYCHGSGRTGRRIPIEGQDAILR